MKILIYTLLMLTSLAAHAGYNETVDDKAHGRQNCQGLLYEFHGNLSSTERARELLVDAFKLGAWGEPDETSVPALQIRRADVETVQLLAVVLDKSLPEVIGEYANGAMMLANALGYPGRLTPEIRMQCARAQIHLAPWLSAAKILELEAQVKKLIYGK